LMIELILVGMMLLNNVLTLGRRDPRTQSHVSLHVRLSVGRPERANAAPLQLQLHQHPRAPPSPPEQPHAVTARAASAMDRRPAWLLLPPADSGPDTQTHQPIHTHRTLQRIPRRRQTHLGHPSSTFHLLRTGGNRFSLRHSAGSVPGHGQRSGEVPDAI